MSKKNKKRLNVGPIMFILLISIVLLLLSFILNKIGFKGYLIDPETNERTIVTVNNIFSRTGLKYIFSNAVLNFRLIEPLVVLIMSFISISILEASGLLNHVLKPLKNIKSSYLTFLILFISIISTIIGDYCYATLLPFAGVLYKYIDREPKNGILITFLGITIGYGTGLFYNFQDVILSEYSTITAQNVIATFQNEPLAQIFIMIVSTIVLSFVGANIIDKKFNKKVRKSEETEEKIIESKLALRMTGLVFLLLILISIYFITPGFPFSGVLLDMDEKLYISKLFGSNSPFREGFLLLFIMIFMICGYVYGRLSRNIKNTREYNKSISKSFENTGFLFAIMFFASIMISIIEWTNIGNVICLNIVQFMSNLEFNGLFLIITVFILCVIATLFIPSTTLKWTMISPVMVPLLLRANISPAFTTMIFKAADSIGKCFTPLYIYFIIMIGLLYKYDDDGEEIKIISVIKKIMPIVLIMTVTWIVIIMGWYLIGFKIGVNTYPTI